MKQAAGISYKQHQHERVASKERHEVRVWLSAVWHSAIDVNSSSGCRSSLLCGVVQRKYFQIFTKIEKNSTVNISDRSCMHRHTISQTTHEQVQKKPVDEVDNVFQDADFPRQYKIKK